MVVMIVTTNNSFAQTSTVVIDGLCYSLNTKNNTATLISNGYGKYSGNIVVPAQITLSNCIKFPVVAFGEECFEMCKNLTSISIPKSVTSLGENCFYACTGLKNLTIPSSVKSLGYACFSGCSGLESISVPSSVDEFGTECFFGCSALTEFKIPSSVTSIGRNCFFGCTSLTTITIPSSVKAFENGSFYNCLKLSDIYFKGDVPKNIIYSDLPKKSNLYVPEKYLQNFIDEIGSRCPNISIWNPTEAPEETTDEPKESCSTPSISYSDGQLQILSNTPNSEYHYTITNSDMISDGYSQDGSIKLAAIYNVSAYATADGFLPSEIATASLYWISDKAENENPSNVKNTKSRGILVTSEGGIVTISGLNDGDKISFYNLDGKQLGTAVVQNEKASIALSEKIVLVNISGQTIKIVVK